MSYYFTSSAAKAGSRLYTHFDLDHEELFRVTATLAGDFLMTYDDAEGVRDLTSAVLDRLLHHAETVLIEGSSYRMNDRIES